MAQTHFERLLDEEQEQLKNTLLKIPPDNSHRVAMVQGQWAGLDKARDLFRKAARVDVEESL